MTENCFCFRHKNSRKHKEHSKLLYFKLNSHFGKSNYLQEIKFTSHKQYLFGRLFSRNANKTYTDQSTLQVFFLCIKRNDSQTFKSSSRKKLFVRVHVIDTTCYNECFLFYLITESHCFYSPRISEFFAAANKMSR